MGEYWFEKLAGQKPARLGASNCIKKKLEAGFGILIKFLYGKTIYILVIMNDPKVWPKPCGLAYFMDGTENIFIGEISIVFGCA
jgi:hypothetical protein